MSAWHEVLAPAKVNLTLAVLGRRPDGFHELDTLMMALDLCDRVRARRRAEPGLALAVGGPQASPDVTADERNLVWRAARGVLDALAPGAGLELALEKHVPSGAGLGGGSADAAAAALAAEAALGGALEPAQRRALLAGLGSDCAFFAAAAATGLARCRGRGELVVSLPPPPPGWWVLLVTPDLSAPTGAVYGALRGPLCSGPDLPSLPWTESGRALAGLRGVMSNRLEEAALRAVPGLRRWKETLSGCGALHFMLSGSGSSFFALHDERTEIEEELARVAAALEREGLRPRLLRLARPAGHGACPLV